MNFKNISLLILISSGYAIGMQQSNQSDQDKFVQTKQQLIGLVNSGNTALSSIAQSGVMSDTDAKTLVDVTTDIGNTTNVLDDLITKIRSTHAQNASDKKPAQVFEDILGDMVDVLEETPKIMQVILPIIQQAQNHPATNYHTTVQTLKTKVAPKK